jgi:4-oxalocrotonate tautomerase family enzyme
MPMISVVWAKGPNQQKKDAAAQKIADAIHEATGAPLTSIWINFEEVETDDFYVGHDTLTELRRKREAATKAAD